MELREEMDLWIQKDEKTNMHFHPEMEIDFVIEGQLEAAVQDTRYSLNKGDLVLFNGGIPHSLRSLEQGTILCCVKFSIRCIAQSAGTENTIFFCNSAEEKGQKYHELGRIFRELVYNYVQRPHKSACLKRSILYKLLDCLLENFQMDLGIRGAAHAEDMKLIKIFQYVNQNFQYSVSLTELADQLYVSKSTLSRFFKKQTGIYFADYVNQVRVKYATEDLIYSNKNITKIAVDCGFSNPSVFNKVFREIYGLSPSDYRQQEGKAGQQRQKEREQLWENLRMELKERMDEEQESAIQEQLSVHADTAVTRAFPRKWGRCINIGSAYNLTVANLQYHAVYLKEHLGFRYGRIWSIFSRRLMISDGKTRGYYNYDKIDGVLDFLVSNHIIPFLDFGNRPDTAIYSPGQPVFREEEYISFQSREAWEDLVQDFILHITNRYGENEASKWIFEFSCDSANAPESDYYQDENYSYFQAFQFARRVIKGFLPKAQVGGPMGQLVLDYDLTARFLQFCGQNQCMPDFVSFMLFPYHTDSRDDQVLSQRAATEALEREQVEMMRRVMEENGAGDCLLYVTEWNNTLSNRNYLNDSCFRASYIVKKVSEIAEMTDMLAIWMASDWMSSYYDTVKIANGGSGLLTKDSIRKPAYFALLFLHMSGEQLIAKGANYLITESGKGNYHILCFHYKWFGCNYFIQEEGVREPDKVEDLFEDDSSVELDIYLENLGADSEYVVKKRMVSQKYGSVLDEWKNFQYDRRLDNADIKYIRDSCFPKMSMERLKASQGCLHIQTALLPHEIQLLHVYEQ